MTFLSSIKRRKVHLVIWYTDSDTSIQVKVFQDKEDAAKFYDGIVKRGVVFSGFREEEIG